MARYQRILDYVDAVTFQVGMESGFDIQATFPDKSVKTYACLEPETINKLMTELPAKGATVKKLYFIDTVKGHTNVNIGDYIVTDAAGNKFAYTPTVFLKFYK